MDAAQWRRIQQLRDGGTPIKAIARELGIARNTVRRALASDAPPEDRRRRPQPTVAQSYLQRIAAILTREPAITATAIARELDWPYSMTTLRVHVRGLRAPAGRTADPRARGRDTKPPVTLTSFVGRAGELAAIRGELGNGRLVTLTGFGGIGKSRLAYRAADRMRRAFPDGVRTVELAVLRDPTLLGRAFVDQLGLGHHDGPVGPEALLHEYLAERHLLLVIDNCEHLLPALANLIARLLSAAPDLRVLATSRQALGIPGERILVVPPLPVPERAEDGERDSAMTLFADRAASVVPGFSVTAENAGAVRRVCNALDGIPLGIELAANHLRTMSVEQLVQRLDERAIVLATGSGGGEARHRSLDATMDWSYGLCTDFERRMWARAAVFAGGFDLDAAQQVCAGPGLEDGVAVALAGLVDKSILRREESAGRVRFTMLEPIREAGRARLTGEELETYRRRHLAWCEEFLRAVAAAWFGSSQAFWYQRVLRERSNLRAALDFALSVPSLVPSAQGLVSECWFLWALTSMSVHRHWLELALQGGGEDTVARARAVGTLGLVCTLQGDRAPAREYHAAAGRLAREGGSEQVLAYVLHMRGLDECFAENYSRSRELLSAAEIGYARSDLTPGLMLTLHMHIGLLGAFDGRPAEAERELIGVVDECERAGEEWLAAYARAILGLIAIVVEDYEGAVGHVRTALRVQRHYLDAVAVALSLDVIAWAEAGRGRAERAATLLGAASVMWRSFGAELYDSASWVAYRTHFGGLARAALGDAPYQAAFDRGAGMPRGDAITFALEFTAPTPPPVSTPAGGLSSREEQVARLVAEGLTNKQIATRLVVSPRTVEGHVGAALRKLGFARRTQLAAWATLSPETAPGDPRGSE